MTEFADLGATVASLTKSIASLLEAGKHAKPSFAADCPATFPAAPAIQEPRLQLIETLTDLLHLATGAGDYLFLHGGLFVSNEYFGSALQPNLTSR